MSVKRGLSSPWPPVFIHSTPRVSRFKARFGLFRRMYAAVLEERACCRLEQPGPSFYFCTTPNGGLSTVAVSRERPTEVCGGRSSQLFSRGLGPDSEVRSTKTRGPDPSTAKNNLVISPPAFVSRVRCISVIDPTINCFTTDNFEDSTTPTEPTASARCVSSTGASVPNTFRAKQARSTPRRAARDVARRTLYN